MHHFILKLAQLKLIRVQLVQLKQLLLIFGLITSSNSFANLSISKAIIHFEESGKLSEDIEVINQGSDTIYVRIEPSLIKNPGTKNETREIYRNPKLAGLLVTPQRMIIAPGSRKRLRFVRLDKNSILNNKPANNSEPPSPSFKEKVFRVLIKPEVGEVTSTETAVKILIAYEALVLFQPAKAKPKIDYQFSKNLLNISNNGNTNALFLDGHQCPENEVITDKNNHCEKLSGKRLYAGNQWQLKLPYLTPVTFKLSVGRKNSTITFKPKKTKR